MNVREVATQFALAAVAGVLLFWGLGDKYLWQDEAATAILARNMIKFGKPLAYDGVNLVTIDFFLTEKGDIDKRVRDPKAAVDYYIGRGDMKRDTAWIWHPWGQFAAAAAGLKALGQNTVGARVPFALAGLAAVLLLYRLAHKYCGGWQTATIAALLLLADCYWILHARQCRYYALSSLLLLLTVTGYLRWQERERWGAAAFLAAAWCWFQVDYGTVWPVFAVLFVYSLAARRRTVRETVIAGAMLAAALAPFVYYYHLWGRRMPAVRDRWEIFAMSLFNTNQYVLPVVVLAAAVVLLAWRWRRLAPAERGAIAIACAVVALFVVWVPAISPDAFLRYLIIVAPLGCLAGGWFLARLFPPRYAWMPWMGALVWMATPWLSLPVTALVPPDDRYEAGTLWRWEIPMMAREIFGTRPDPNRLTVEWLRRNAAPADEILVNYEDLPLAFYLPNPIRGGIPAFRVEDDARTPPRFVVLRHAVEFVHKDIYDREMGRYRWVEAPVKIPDLIWGNNPDPMMWDNYPAEIKYLYIARRVE